MSSSSSDLVPVALRDACRRTREMFSFSSFRGREETGTHLLRIRGYSTVQKKLGHRMFFESPTFRAGGHSWTVEYYPNGYASGHPSVMLKHKGISFLGIGNIFLGYAAGATAQFTVSILDRHGNQVYSHSSAPYHYSLRGTASFIEVMNHTAEERREKLRLAEEDTLFVKCDVTVHKMDKESNIKFFLRRLLLD